MPVTFAEKAARFEGHCSVEEALPFSEFLGDDASIEVGLDDCLSMHTALLQALVAVRPKIVSFPSVEPLGGLTRRLFGEG